MMLFFMLACGFALDLTPGDLCDGLDREHKLSNGSTICGSATDACRAEADLQLVACRGGLSPVVAADPALAAHCAQTHDIALSACAR